MNRRFQNASRSWPVFYRQPGALANNDKQYGKPLILRTNNTFPQHGTEYGRLYVCWQVSLEGCTTKEFLTLTGNKDKCHAISSNFCRNTGPLPSMADNGCFICERWGEDGYHSRLHRWLHINMSSLREWNKNLFWRMRNLVPWRFFPPPNLPARPDPARPMCPLR